MSEAYVDNPFNPGGIRATLERWYADEGKQDQWVCFDGVSVLLAEGLSNQPEHIRSICLVSELGGVLSPDTSLSLEDFLYNDF